MAELLATIALLCQVASAPSITLRSNVNKFQLNCQKYYIRCVQTVSASNVLKMSTALDSCVLNKGIK